jgi:DNA-binding winged helix-turn-helix (wHTH) protein/tetratricopeptide (TPR) repeat protein
MKHLVSQFGRFEIDHTAHELRRDGVAVNLPVSAFDCLTYLIEHRDRPVDRDEIILAVWGRPDVSETLLGQTIARLRRELGDTGSDQHTIRTISRKGYRWVAPIQSGSPTAQTDQVAPASARELEPGEEQAKAESVPRVAARPGRIGRMPAVLFFGAVIVLGFAGLLWSLDGQRRAINESTGPVLVLPSSTKASADWDWLRFGLMDLLSNRLRQGGQPTLTSESVVSLLQSLQGARGPDGSWLHDSRLDGKSRLRVQPTATLASGQWTVHLAVVEGNVSMHFDARSSDVLAAASQAADLLLVKLGRQPPPTDVRDPPEGLKEIVQRAKAAALAGNIESARSIIRNAPESLRSSPELAWSAALAEAYAGNYELAREGLLAALSQMPGESDPVLRARMLTLLGAMYMRRAESGPAAKAYEEAIRLAEGGDDLSVLSHAYAGRAVVEATDRQYDDALTDFGRARALSEKAGNVLGEAQIDMNVGSIMNIRGQPASAERTLEDAARRLRALSSQEEWAVAMQGVADAQMRMLDSINALRTAESFSPPQAEIADKKLRWSLSLTYARALAANGLMSAGRAEAQLVWDATSDPRDSLFRANAAEALARFAIIDRDWEKAASLAASALTRELERADVLVFMHAWQMRMEALRRLGAIAEARAATDAYIAWLRNFPTASSPILVAFAEAGQARAEGRNEDATKAYVQAFEAAERSGVPEDIVAIGTSLADLVLGDGDLMEASSLVGRLAPWADRDPRIADLERRIEAANQSEIAHGHIRRN